MYFWKEISEKKLKAAEIPPYLRFDVKLLNMASYEGTIEERFEWVQMILQPFKKALTGSKLKFLGTISNSDLFKDSSSLLDYIDKTFQISDRCRAYKLYISSQIYENTSTHVLAALLQFDAIIRCSKIRVQFNLGYPMQTHLPIEDIGNWLNCTNANGQMHNERFLKLKFSHDIQNLGEMFEHLKKVYLLFCVKLLQQNMKDKSFSSNPTLEQTQLNPYLAPFRHPSAIGPIDSSVLQSANFRAAKICF